MPTRSFTFVISFWLTFLVSIAMSLAAPVLNHQPIDTESFIVSLIVATIVGTIVSFVLPVAKWGDMFAHATGAKAGSAAEKLLSAMIPGSIMLAALSFVLLALQTGFGIIDGFSFVDRWVGAFLSLWPVVYLTIVLVQPSCMWLTLRMVKNPFISVSTESMTKLKV